jgi:hypothetical protein
MISDKMPPLAAQMIVAGGSISTISSGICETAASVSSRLLYTRKQRAWGKRRWASRAAYPSPGSIKKVLSDVGSHIPDVPDFFRRFAGLLSGDFVCCAGSFPEKTVWRRLPLKGPSLRLPGSAQPAYLIARDFFSWELNSMKSRPGRGVENACLRANSSCSQMRLTSRSSI